MQRFQADESSPTALGVAADRGGYAGSTRNHKQVPTGEEKGTVNNPIPNRLLEGLSSSSPTSPTRLVELQRLRRSGIDARKEQRVRENTILKRLYRCFAFVRSLLLLFFKPRRHHVDDVGGTNMVKAGSCHRGKAGAVGVREHCKRIINTDTTRKGSDADTDLSLLTDYFMIKNRPRTLMDRVLYRFRQQPLLKLWSFVLVVVELLVLYEFCVLRAPAHVASAWLSEGYPAGRGVGGTPQNKHDDAQNNLVEGTTMMKYDSTPVGDALFVSQFMCLIIPRALFYLFYENIAVAAFAAFIHVGEIFHFWALGKAQGRVHEERNTQPYNWGGDQYFVFGFILVNGPLYVYHLIRLVRLIIFPRKVEPHVAVAAEGQSTAEGRERGVSEGLGRGSSSLPLLLRKEKRAMAPIFYRLLMGCWYFSNYGIGLLWNASRAVWLMWLALEMISGVWTQHPSSKRASEVNSFFFNSLHTEDATIIAISVTIVASVGLFMAVLTPFFQRAAPRGLCDGSGGGTHRAKLEREQRHRQQGHVSAISNARDRSCRTSSIFAARAPVVLMGICVELFILLPMTLAAILQEYSTKIHEERIILGHNSAQIFSLIAVSSSIIYAFVMLANTGSFTAAWVRLLSKVL